jgi:ABC-2 type transport system permease protein
MIVIMPIAIETQSLTKRFSQETGWRSAVSRNLDKPAVDRVDLQVKQGELFGLVGPNGAGKTTLIKMLATLVMPTSGKATINGFGLSQELDIKRSVGLVTSDERSFYWRLTGQQNLEFFAALHGLGVAEARSRSKEVIKQVGLQDHFDKPFQKYSTGMKQRLSIARALLVYPKILFLDEPTKGLDPEATQELYVLIREQLTREAGITVFLTSHNLYEIQRLCDRVAIMTHGRLRACGSLQDLSLILDYGDRYQLQVQGWNSKMRQALLEQNLEVSIEESDEQSDSLLRVLHDDIDNLNQVLDVIRQKGGKIAQVTRQQMSLDKIFTHVTYRFSFILQFLNVFFSVAVFYFVAMLLGDSINPYLEPYGGDYFAFVLIGIAFGSYFSVGLSSFSRSLRSAQMTGTLEAMLSTPTRISTIILSSSQWNYLMTTLRVIVYLMIGTLFMDVNFGNANYLAAFVILLLTVVTFSSLGIIAAGFIMVLKRGDPITWIFGAVSSLLGGIYYPIMVLPGWMQTLAKLIPVTYALRAMRLALLQGASFSELRGDIITLGIFCLVLLPLSLMVFGFAVRLARIDGSLTHY